MIRLFREYLPPYRLPIALVLLLLLVQAIANLYLPELNAEIINNGVATGDTEYILRTGGFMLAVTFVIIAALGFVLYFALMPETRGAVRAGSEPESGGGRTPAVPVRA